MKFGRPDTPPIAKFCMKCGRKRGEVEFRSPQAYYCNGCVEVAKRERAEYLRKFWASYDRDGKRSDMPMPADKPDINELNEWWAEVLKKW